ncbi:hypothetical protein KR059_006547 [Drosophila kikkawai]|nr:hypothetical protein KR059_006547 [Drosophila kikkawai]
MNNSDSSKKSTDALKYEKDEHTSKILKSMECFEDVHKPNVTKSSQEISLSKSSGSPASEEDNQRSLVSKSEEKDTESEANNDYTSFLKHMSVRYSHYLVELGEVKDKKGKKMDYSDYSCSECAACEGPSCSWQVPAENGQDCSSGAQMDYPPPMDMSEMSEDGHYYSYGKSLPNSQSGSDETIVNEPRRSPSQTSQNPACSVNSFCCPLRRPGQKPVCYSCNQGYPSQEHFMSSSISPPMEVDPSSGYPYYNYPEPGSYPGMAMRSMGNMQLDQRGRGGQKSEDTRSGSPPTSSPSLAGGANNLNSSAFNMEEFMQKYQKSLQQCYATAQQGIQQTFAQANSQPFFSQPSQGNPQHYPTTNPGAQQMFANPNQATPQYYDNTNQEAFPDMQQAFNSPVDPQQFFNSSNLGGQSFMPTSMSMQPPDIFGSNTGFISDTLHTQTVYSSDYKAFSNSGNQFNHFPNGIDIGLGPDSCPDYRPAGYPGLAEMGAGGQANMNSYPLSQMSYSSPYSYDMSSPSPGHLSGHGNPM